MTIQVLFPPKSKARTVGWVLATLIIFSFPAAGEASAAETHLFSALHSLVGKCEPPESADPVPDPGCPGGTHPPAGRFKVPRSEAVDSYGNLYVANTPNVGSTAGSNIDVFSPSGTLITELPDGHGPQSIAVDSEGHLYVHEHETGGINQVVRFDPQLPYEPALGQISYNTLPAAVISESVPLNAGIAIDSSSAVGHRDRLYIDMGDHVDEYGSAVEGNLLLNAKIGEGVLKYSVFIAVDAANHDIYAGNSQTLESRATVKVLDGEASGHPPIRTIDGACLSAGHFGSNSGLVSIAIDESNGHVFVDDRDSTAGAKAVYEFTETGGCVFNLEKSFRYAFPSQIAIDNGAHSPNGALDAPGRYLYVPSGEAQSESHVYAFEPRSPARPPRVEALSPSNVTETEAALLATINPEGGRTHYAFEVTSQESFEAQGFTGASLAGEGDIPAGTSGVSVTASAGGLTPATAYRFRVRATNACETVPLAECEGEREATFTTFGEEPPATACPNDALRTGLSAALPDCRAYELVSPPETGGRPLSDPENGNAGDKFGTPTASPNGGSVAFLTDGGVIPGTDGAGGFNGTTYVSTRTAGGWQTESVGPSGTQSSNPLPGGMSPDLGFAVTTATEVGSLPISGKETRYVRHPDGSFHLLGEGSLGIEPTAAARFVAADGSHIIFMTGSPANQLEPNAPPSGTKAIYDRTPDEVTHVVSLLPGNVTPGATQSSEYLGASSEGNAVAFEAGGASPLFVRLNDAETQEITGAGATFAGLSSNGRYTFYLAGGDLFRYDTVARAATEITATHDATVVNVGATGSAVYFVSQSILTGLEKNPNGTNAQAGQENLYRWSERGTRFVAIVTKRDVQGEFSGPGGFQFDGLGLWTRALAGNETAIDSSRADPSGDVLLFQSRLNLAGYDSNGKTEVYRFDATTNTLTCLSCNPTGAPAASDATLQSVSRSSNEPSPTSRFTLIPNLSVGGERAFFQTSDALVPADTDGLQDVYEWEARGVGSCGKPNGCVSLVSSGASARENYLYGVSESGEDVFISSSDILVGAGTDETPSIYDARVRGGFPLPPSAPAECLGEACQPTAVGLNDSTPASVGFNGPGNAALQSAAKIKTKAKPANGKLIKALAACEKKRKAQRRHCRAQARKRYGRRAKKSTRARNAGFKGRTVR